MAKVALLIAVSEYGPGLAALPEAVKDAEAMQRVLKDPDMGGFDTVRTLANPDRQAMQDEIEALFSRATKDDLVLLSISGHGIKDDAGQLYFATRMTRKNEKGNLVRSSAVPGDLVHNIMNKSLARRQAIILDCCFSGAFDPELHTKDDGSVDFQSQLEAEGRFVLAKSGSTRYLKYLYEQRGVELSLCTNYVIAGIYQGNRFPESLVQEVNDFIDFISNKHQVQIVDNQSEVPPEDAWSQWFKAVDDLSVTLAKPEVAYPQLLLTKYRQQGLDL